jgi:hypothetical protein
MVRSVFVVVYLVAIILLKEMTKLGKILLLEDTYIHYHFPDFITINKSRM